MLLPPLICGSQVRAKSQSIEVHSLNSGKFPFSFKKALPELREWTLIKNIKKRHADSDSAPPPPNLSGFHTTTKFTWILG